MDLHDDADGENDAQPGTSSMWGTSFQKQQDGSAGRHDWERQGHGNEHTLAGADHKKVGAFDVRAGSYGNTDSDEFENTDSHTHHGDFARK